MNKIALFLLISLTSQFSLADGNIVTYLDMGSPAPYNGYLFNPPAEKTARQYKADSIYYKQQYELSTKLNAKQAELNNNLQDQINVLGKIASVQEEQLKNSRNNNIYYAVGGAILSALVYNHVK